MSNGKTLFWLYYGNVVVTSILLPSNTPKSEVIAKVLKQNEPTMFTIHGLGTGVAPYEFESMIRQSEVRT